MLSDIATRLVTGKSFSYAMKISDLPPLNQLTYHRLEPIVLLTLSLSKAQGPLAELDPFNFLNR